MISVRVQRVAEQFWDRAGPPPGLPRDLRGPILLSLPLAVMDLSQLSTARVQAWLSERCRGGLEVRTNRPLRAAVVAEQSRGIIFLDATDPPEECRFSLAHELAHILLDLHQPRARADRLLGETFAPVLDGTRSPTWEERIDAALAGVEIRPFVHLMERSDLGGMHSERVSVAEYQADCLALELLAPESAVRNWIGRHTTQDELIQVLTEEFGLPVGPSQSYARRLLPKPPPHGSLVGLLRE